MIQLYSSDDLMEELMSRFDDVILSARRIKDQNDNTERVVHYKGDYDACIGLAEQVKMSIVNEIWKKENPGD